MSEPTPPISITKNETPAALAASAAAPVSTPAPALPRKFFREEAIAHQQEKFWGEVLSARPLPVALLSILALAAAAGLAAYLVWGEYTRKVKVTGYLAPQVGVVKVAAPQAGVLTELLDEGKAVKAGDVIAKITLERDPGSEARQSALKNEIEKRRDSLKSERARMDVTLIEQVSQAQRREATSKLELDALTSEMAAAADRVTALNGVAERFEKLYKEGFVGPNQSEQKRAEALEARTKLEAMRRTRAQLLRDIETAQGDKRNLALKKDSMQGDVDRQLSSLDRERVDTDDRAREISVTAPIDGTIATRGVTRGQTVALAAQLVTVLPAQNDLQAELLVPTRAAGFVKPGQVVALRYQAFPFERFGHAVGTVKEIGRSVLAAGETGPMALTEPVYRVVVSLPQQTMNAYGQAMDLRAGMVLDADIQLEKRKLYEWLIEPIIAAVGRA
jgi:membrane fusion protein